MRILDKDLDEKLRKLLVQYKFLDRVIQEYINEHQLLENTILDYFYQYELNELYGVKKSKMELDPTMTIKELKQAFNNEDSVFLDSLVVSLNTSESLDSLKYHNSISEPILKALETKLNNLGKVDLEFLVVERDDEDE